MPWYELFLVGGGFGAAWVPAAYRKGKSLIAKIKEWANEPEPK